MGGLVIGLVFGAGVIILLAVGRERARCRGALARSHVALVDATRQTRALERTVQRQQATIRALDAKCQVSEDLRGRLSVELGVCQREAAQVEQQSAGLSADLRQSERRVAHLEARLAATQELGRALQPIVEQTDASRRMHQALSRQLEQQERTLLGVAQETVGAIQPLSRWQRVRAALSRLRCGGSRHEIAGLLTRIADLAGFSLVVLSDARGLVVAASDDAQDAARARASLSALALPLVDASVNLDEAPPRSLVMRDTQGRTVVLRILSIQGCRFLLTAVSAASGLEVPVDILDGVVSKLDQLLRDWTVVAAHA